MVCSDGVEDLELMIRGGFFKVDFERDAACEFDVVEFFAFWILKCNVEVFVIAIRIFINRNECEGKNGCGGFCGFRSCRV